MKASIQSVEVRSSLSRCIRADSADHTKRMETLVKDDQLWRDLKRLLSESKIVSKAGVQEITRKFMEQRQGELDKHQQHEQASEPQMGRKNSDIMDNGRQSRLSLLTSKGRHVVVRALSLRNLRGRESRRTEMITQSTTDLSSSLRSLHIENRNEAGNISVSNILQQAEERLNALDTSGEAITAFPLDQKLDSARERTSFSRGPLQGIDERSYDNMSYGSISCGSVDDLEEGKDLLVLFPSKPRRATQTAVSA